VGLRVMTDTLYCYLGVQWPTITFGKQPRGGKKDARITNTPCRRWKSQVYKTSYKTTI